MKRLKLAPRESFVFETVSNSHWQLQAVPVRIQAVDACVSRGRLVVVSIEESRMARH